MNQATIRVIINDPRGKTILDTTFGVTESDWDASCLAPIVLHPVEGNFNAVAWSHQTKSLTIRNQSVFEIANNIKKAILRALASQDKHE